MYVDVDINIFMNRCEGEDGTAGGRRDGRAGVSRLGGSAHFMKTSLLFPCKLSKG